MRHIDIRKKRPSAWPWIVGVVLLLLVGWGVTTLLTADEEDEPGVSVPTVQDTMPPALIPQPPQRPRESAPRDSAG